MNPRRVLFRGFNPRGDVRIARHHLPHWTQPGATYFVTFRLGDSVPATLLNEWREERETWLRWHPEPWSCEVEAEYRERFTERQEAWLDAGFGECHLRRADIRAQLGGHVTHFDGVRYDHDAWVLMPNHVHALITPRGGHHLFDLLKGIKGTSARTCNRLLGRTGCTFWMEDSYNRIVRDAEELMALRAYIAANPSVANLREGEFTLVMNVVLEIQAG